MPGALPAQRQNREPIELPALSKVYITQQLGGSYTVMTDYGLARIDGRDADALGQDIAAAHEAANQTKAEEKPKAPSGETPDEEAIWQQLRNVYDPEIHRGFGLRRSNHERCGMCSEFASSCSKRSGGRPPIPTKN